MIGCLCSVINLVIIKFFCLFQVFLQQSYFLVVLKLDVLVIQQNPPNWLEYFLIVKVFFNSFLSFLCKLVKKVYMVVLLYLYFISPHQTILYLPTLSQQLPNKNTIPNYPHIHSNLAIHSFTVNHDTPKSDNNQMSTDSKQTPDHQQK